MSRGLGDVYKRQVYGKLADGTFKPLRDVNEEGTSYTLDQISDGTIEVTEVK